MIIHPKLQCLVVTAKGGALPELWQLIDEEMETIQLSYATELPKSCGEYDAVVTCGAPRSPAATQRLLDYVRDGGGWFVMLALDKYLLPDAFGVQPGPVGPRVELRVLFQEYAQPIAERLPKAIYVAGCFHPLEVHAPDVQTLLYTDWHYSHKAVLTTRNWGKGQLACSTLQDFSAPMLRQVIHRLLRQWHGSGPEPKSSFGVGILGYAPSVGLTHGRAVRHTPGFHLQAVCDMNPERLTQAGADFPGVTSYVKAARMTEDPNIDLVVVATAPNVHARLSIEMMAAGKHVLCEKPLALNSQETDAMLEAATRHSVHLSCHQNRRWDPDFRTILDCVKRGRIGELFHVETFVGGFHHPCGYWHSDRSVSGGTTFDWGAHYLDWLVGLLPETVAAVCGTRHKRVWHDVSNADQERIIVRFDSGKEAEFLHSDIAAVRKPKWYLLGTEGAILGQWQDIMAVEADPVYYFNNTDIPATEMMPALSLYRRSTSGDIEEIVPALPPRDMYAFHRNLADHLLWGEPLVAPLNDSVKVVSILAAAARSMDNGGRWEEIDE